MSTAVMGRLAALTRAEMILLVRHKAVLVTALVLPLAMTFAMQSLISDLDLEDAGLTLGTMLMPSMLGFVFLFGVYSALVTVYVVRRDQLVLKRLRTGEPGDLEILGGTASATLVAGVVQCLVLAVAGALVLDVEAPSSILLVVLGALFGLVLATGLAAVTAAFTKSAEGAQLTITPMLLVSMIGSGMVVPLELMPEKMASVCELLPLSPAVQLVRGGWTGTLSTYDVLGAVAVALAWTVVSVFAVQKWFRWEPRR
ncbi:ABC transporter permease [Streptomyces sp. NPDC050504]|uniref:ABC transporter permease n=1 Tax=Streptomyces sp. NPDC050504 TaxID=3365618 RepID=UPI0037BB875E